MHPRRPPPLEALVGSGDIATPDLAPGLGGGGQLLRDARSRDLFARITGQPDATRNAYAFVRADDFDPAAFPSLTGAAEQGDGTALVAYEVTGRTDVPTDGTAVVRLFPLAAVAGYGFVYTSAPAPVPAVYGRSVLAGLYTFANPTGVWQDAASALPSITIPEAGVYQIQGYVGLHAVIPAGAALPATGLHLAARLFDPASGDAIDGAQVAASTAYSGTAWTLYETRRLAIQADLPADLTLRWQVLTDATIGAGLSAYVGTLDIGPAGLGNDLCTLSYLKIG